MWITQGVALEDLALDREDLDLSGEDVGEVAFAMEDASCHGYFSP